MDKGELITIIVPCYNCESTIERCMLSILDQTYKYIEVLAVNDGSSDGTMRILEELSKKHPQIKVLQQQNSGPGAARNLGIRHAKGRYFYFMDSDDRMAPNMLEKLVSSGISNNSDVVICNYYNVYADSRLQEMRHCLNAKYLNHNEVVQGIIRQFYDGDYTGLSSLWNKLYRADLLIKHDVWFDENLYRGEDWWFNQKVYDTASIITTISDALYYYYQGNGTNLMSRYEARLYQEWKEARVYLTQKNSEYKFELQMDIYYRQLLFNIHSLLIKLARDNDAMAQILNDSYYNEIVKYDALTSKAVKFCHFLHFHSITVEIWVYKILSVIYKHH